jgi:hypothetical protein
VTTPAQPIQALEKKAGVFLTTHHVILYVILAVAIGMGIYFIVSKNAAIQEARAQAAEQALAVEKDHSAQLTAQYTANEAKRQQELLQIYSTIAQIKSQTKVQIVHDQAAPAPEVGHRIETITGFQQGTIALSPKDELIVPLPVAHSIVALLDQGEADAKIVKQQQGVIDTQTSTITDQKAIIEEDKKVLAAQIDTDTKVLNAEKANARKGKLKWFGIGYVAGLATRGVVKIFTGV